MPLSLDAIGIFRPHQIYEVVDVDGDDGDPAADTVSSFLMCVSTTKSGCGSRRSIGCMVLQQPIEVPTQVTNSTLAGYPLLSTMEAAMARRPIMHSSSRRAPRRAAAVARQPRQRPEKARRLRELLLPDGERALVLLAHAVGARRRRPTRRTPRRSPPPASVR